MTESAQRFFVDEICDLGLLKRCLDVSRYRLTKRGRRILQMRLHSTYDDGVKYNLATNIVREVKIQPIIDLEPKLMKSQATASVAKALSKTIGQEIGINF